jgi:hypothetical protein
MYGVPSDLDLTRFYGAEVIQLAIGTHQLQVHLQPGEGSSLGQLQTIGIEGHWELRDGSGAVIDQAQDPATREVYRAHRVLGQRVTAGSLDAPKSFSLQFDNGLVLTVFDDSKQYESFFIQPGDIFV